MKIAPAFSTGPLWQCASHKSVFFDRKFGSSWSVSSERATRRGFESHPLRSNARLGKGIRVILDSCVHPRVHAKRGLPFGLGRGFHSRPARCLLEGAHLRQPTPGRLLSRTATDEVANENADSDRQDE